MGPFFPLPYILSHSFAPTDLQNTGILRDTLLVSVKDTHETSRGLLFLAL